MTPFSTLRTLLLALALGLGLTLVLAANSKAQAQLQVGVKYKPDECPLKSRKGDKLSMQWVGRVRVCVFTHHRCCSSAVWR
jgi:hypothetical protein